ncbi:MAG: stage III sporulation protein AB [Bacillota bacterium]
MLKLLGSLMVITATGIYGITVAQHYARRPRELRALEIALAMLETEISYGATPLAEAFDGVAQRADPLVSGLFVYARDELAAGKGITAADAWQRAIGAFVPDSALKGEDVAALRGLGPILGGSGREDQVRHIRLTVEHLKVVRVRAEEEALKNVRLWQYLGFLGGIAVVLVIL